MKALTIAAFFVASVLLIGVTSATSPAYAEIGTSLVQFSFLDMFFGFGDCKWCGVTGGLSLTWPQVGGISEWD